MKVLVAIVVTLVVLLCVIALAGAHLVMNGKRPTLQEAWERQGQDARPIGESGAARA